MITAKEANQLMVDKGTKQKVLDSIESMIKERINKDDGTTHIKIMYNDFAPDWLRHVLAELGYGTIINDYTDEDGDVTHQELVIRW